MGKADPLSVVLISRNRSGQLSKVLTALADNSLRPAEVILADDASTDDTVAVFERICAELSLPARTLAHEPGETPFRINSMRNAALRAARCRRVVILDADHVPGPRNLASHAAMLQAGPKVISTGPRLEYAFDDGAGPVDFMWGHEPVGTIQASDDEPLPFGAMVPASNMGLWVRFAREIGWFDTDYDGAYGFDDIDFTWRASRKGAFFAGQFNAYVIHIPHQTSLGRRDSKRNAEIFERKHGFRFAYPPLIEAMTHSESWARRYERLQAARADEPGLGPAPDPGADGIRATRWASTNVGGRFLLRLAGEKLLARLAGRNGPK